jgi:TIR domain
MSANKIRVFVSHSRADRPIAEKLIRELLNRGIDASSYDRIAPPESWQTTISGLLKSADGVILLIGAKQDPSPWQRREWSAALEAKWEYPNKRLIPVLLPGAQIPTFLSEYQALRLKPSKQEWTSTVNELIHLLHHDSTRSKITRSSTKDSAKRNERLQYIERAAENLRQR